MKIVTILGILFNVNNEKIPSVYTSDPLNKLPLLILSYRVEVLTLKRIPCSLFNRPFGTKGSLVTFIGSTSEVS